VSTITRVPGVRWLAERTASIPPPPGIEMSISATSGFVSPMPFPQEIGIDDFQSGRAPDGRYRTAPLKGLFSHAKGGFYHDGRFATLADVVAHYDTALNLGLSTSQESDLVQYLLSL
jgi:hypothetical protein